MIGDVVEVEGRIEDDLLGGENEQVPKVVGRLDVLVVHARCEWQMVRSVIRHGVLALEARVTWDVRRRKRLHRCLLHRRLSLRPALQENRVENRF